VPFFDVQFCNITNMRVLYMCDIVLAVFVDTRIITYDQLMQQECPRQRWLHALDYATMRPCLPLQ
jgi:hypothetical protein